MRSSGMIFEQLLRGAAVRVDEGETFAVPDVLDGEILEQGRLAHARLPDHVHVPLAVLLLDAEGHALAARIGGGEVSDALGIIHRASV